MEVGNILSAFVTVFLMCCMFVLAMRLGTSTWLTELQI